MKAELPRIFHSALVQKSWALLRLVRPLNILMIILGVMLGGLLAGDVKLLQGAFGFQLLVAAVSAGLIGGAANSLNDYFDQDVDRVNRPGRPLPSGLVKQRQAIWVWALGSVGGLVLGVLLSPIHAGVAAGAIGLLALYSARLKRSGLLGNLAVALLLGLAIMYGGWAVEKPIPAVIGACFAFLTTLVREIVKDIQDVPGDARAGMNTLPIKYGISAALRFSIALLALTILLTPIPFVTLAYSGLYLLVIGLADALMLRVLWLLLGPDAEGQAGQVSRAMKGAMFVGMVALGLGVVMDLGG